jgi:hypothetical protein
VPSKSLHTWNVLDECLENEHYKKAYHIGFFAPKVKVSTETFLSVAIFSFNNHLDSIELISPNSVIQNLINLSSK